MRSALLLLLLPWTVVGLVSACRGEATVFACSCSGVPAGYRVRSSRARALHAMVTFPPWLPRRSGSFGLLVELEPGVLVRQAGAQVWVCRSHIHVDTSLGGLVDIVPLQAQGRTRHLTGQSAFRSGTDIQCLRPVIAIRHEMGPDMRRALSFGCGCASVKGAWCWLFRAHGSRWQYHRDEFVDVLTQIHT